MKAKKVQQEKVVKLSNYRGKFELQANALRQLNPDGQHLWREASRNSLKKRFQTKVTDKDKGTPVYGKYDTSYKYEVAWYAYFCDKGAKRYLRIGCVRFSPHQTALIKKWALAHKTPKTGTGRKKKA